MTYLTYRNGIKAAYLMFVLTALLMPDVIFGLVLELLHLLLELVHVLFEFIELTLDGLVEHLFHTDLHQTQVIVFYLMWTIALFLLYRLKLMLPRYYRRLQETILTTWLWHKARLIQYWSSVSLIQKT
jgi:hypothetical protein